MQKNIEGNTALESLRKRLLDLTTRNRLINYKHSKSSSLRVIDELPDNLVERLLAEKELRFLPIPEPTRKQLIEAGYIKLDDETGQEIRLKKDPNAEEWARLLGLDTSYEVPLITSGNSEGKHSDNAIQTLLFPYELETRLRNLRQKAIAAIEETGANILYLALGFLEWYETNDSDNPRIAPLFLVPTQLEKGRLNRETGTYEYVLSYSGEDLLPNLSLREKLKIDFAIALPEFEGDTTPENYFQSVKDLIRINQPRWSLRRYITLALLNFSKLLMYLDLDSKRWPEDNQIINHPVAGGFLLGWGAEAEENDTVGDLIYGEEYLIDELKDIHKNYPLIDDADSSQHSALIDAIDGKNIVIEGPPGTGKSQTITNLIAVAMSKGKKVLFVAEKLAALEVVKSRLDAVGLGEFCLELHSHKTQKRKIFEEINKRLMNRGRYRKPSEMDAEIARCEELKLLLKNYVERVNNTWKNTGKTIHEIFMAATRYREELKINPEIFHPVGYNGENLSASVQKRARDQVVAFGDVYRAIAGQLKGDASVNSHPWFGVRNSSLQIFDLERVRGTLEQWQASLTELMKIYLDIGKWLKNDESETSWTLTFVDKLLIDLERLPVLEGDELLDTIPLLQDELIEKFVVYLKLFENIQGAYAVLAEKVSIQVLNDLTLVDNFLRGSKELRRLIDENIDLDTLFNSIVRMNRLMDRIAELEGLILEIQSTVGEAASKRLEISESGLRELKRFIDIVATLNPSCWKLRDKLFDNDELDQVLPEIRQDLDNLYTLRDELRRIYNIDKLPDASALEEIRSLLASGGVFRWFKGSWRSARKNLLACSSNPQIKFSEMNLYLDKAIVFVQNLAQFKQAESYRELLGIHLKGLETDLEPLETLRAWYKSVRQIYGLGFGPKVELGNAIIGLPIKSARAIRSLVEQGTVMKLDYILNELESLKTIFTREFAIQCETVVLVGEGGLLKSILNSLEVAIKDCEPLINDNKISISELLKRVKGLNDIRKDVVNWEDLDYDNKLFNGRLGLRIGLYEDNESALSVSEHTLRLAIYIDQQTTSAFIKQQVYEAPNTLTFESLSSLAKQLRNVMNNQTEKRNQFEVMVAIDRNSWTESCDDLVSSLKERNAYALSNDKSLQNWLDYVRVRNKLTELGFNGLADNIDDGIITIDHVETAYNAGIYDLLAREILREDHNLEQFSGRSQDSIRSQFKEHDERLKRLQCEYIAWQIDQAPVPRGYHGGRVSEYTDIALLDHECAKQTRHIAIRQLLKRAGRALISLKPCFMMGPMSVAQYLEPGQIYFDMVVMDEASQIKPEDAIGSVARGAQLVVVGDPKQLPPSNFFDRQIDEEEEYDELMAIQQVESILDTCIPIFQVRRLRWHYRSQHQSLIAFSNHAFYNSDLVLFPSPYSESNDYGIKFTRVTRGYFINRRNIEEAKVISHAVWDHLRNWPEDTWGVVAMSAQQRDQIEQSIEMLEKEEPLFQEYLERYRSRHGQLLIKNLENVQGDERDVIFLSMTYGPSETGGQVYQRFGPINQDNGWRRLNVLFTRSRKRMHVFSSMGSCDIVVGANSGRGLKTLRDFFAYCESGLLHSTDVYTGRSPDSDFEIAVADALRNEGFECIPQVGVAGFFIDISVVDPYNSGRYLMGIECDGATYHYAKSVRDRDRLRQKILERLGWRIRRIWSTDWFKNPHAELAPIIRDLHDLKSREPIELICEDEIVADNIKEIFDDRLQSVDQIISENVDLKEKLIEFDREFIRKKFPETPENERLLRPAMLESFLEYLPTNKSEFLEYIPAYLRQSTNGDEGIFLDAVLEIINSVNK